MMKLTRTMAWVACGVVVPALSWGQPRPQGSADIHSALEAQRPAMDAYYQCLRDNEKAYARYSLSQQLIVVRDNREAITLSVAKDPAMKARYKSYDDVVADLMAKFRAAGGTAGTIAQVKAEATPCPPPSPKPPSRADLASKSAVSASSSIPAVAADKGPARAAKPAATPKAAEPRPATGATSRRDPRDCLKLSSDKAVMACAEKFR